MNAATSITLSYSGSDLAVLTFDLPGKSANVLSISVLDELEKHLDVLQPRKDLAGLIITSGKPGTFIAGADLREFAASLDIPAEKTFEMCQRGQKLLGRLSQCPFVTVTAIDGTCVGGGAEVAVWCDRRIMSDNSRTEFGFPEVKLGLFPGWGGTVRTPRIVGLANAVEMITSGESIDAETARLMGLASDVVPAEALLDAAIRLVRDEQATKGYLEDRRRWQGPLNISETELGFLGATASAVIQQQTKGQYPAPSAALEVLLGAASQDVDTACQMEADGMSKLFGSPVNASLLNVFFLTDRNKKDTGVANKDVPSRDIKSVTVIGAGIMGSGIAAANIKRNIPLTLSDANRDVLERGVAEVLKEVSYNKKTKTNDVDRAIQYAPLLNGTQSDQEISSSDLVIEAIVENADVKKQVYARLEPLLGPHAILASNTSTIPITSLAENLKHPDRFCGIHFFNPVRRMKLVEIIRGARTTDETIAAAVNYAKKIGKSPIVVNDGPGFLVNRLLLPYMNESLELLAEGAAIRDIEKAAKGFGMPMGPITLYDVVGLDTAFYAGRTMWEAFPDRIGASPILPALVKAGRLGQKSGAGFFSYQNKNKRGEPDPGLDKLIASYMKSPPREFSIEEITHRLFLPMLLEATRVLQDRIVRDVRDIDLGLIFGLGFPPFKGGLLHWADTVGAAKIIKLLARFASLGQRMKPTPLLEKMATEDQKFYELKL